MKILITCMIAIVSCTALYISCSKRTDIQSENSVNDNILSETEYKRTDEITPWKLGYRSNKRDSYDSTQYLNMALLPLHIDTANINKYDSDGLKTGIWYRCDYGWVVIEQFDKGVYNGYIYAYNYRPAIKKYYLWSVELYNNGKLEAMQLFHENGMIQSYMSKFGELKDFKREIYSNNGVLLGSISPGEDGIQYYIICYTENGEKKSEGWEISDNQDEIIMDFCEVGKWIYYKPEGEVIKDYGGEIAN